MIQKLKHYIALTRIKRPIGIWLLFWPAAWSIALAADTPQQMGQPLILFFTGAVFMRSAGCIINDLWDRKLDARVERTKNRPLASGAVTPKEALIFLAILLVLSSVIVMQFNGLTIFLAFASMPLIIAYPLMKRITWWPQAFLGLTFNWGVLMGWSAVTGGLAWPAIILYLACIFWTLAYDTIYAHQDKADDLLVGIKSTAIRFGKHSHQIVRALYMLFIVLLLPLFWENSFGAIVIILLTIVMGYHFKQWRPDDPESSWALFTFQKWVGLTVFLAICARFWTF